MKPAGVPSRLVVETIEMSEPSAENGAENTAYAYRPSLLGAPWEFRLAGDGIDWSAGGKSGHIPFRAVRRLRLSYRPASMQSHRFMTELWADDAPKLEIMSSSWKSLVEQERLDRSYAAFIAELHRRIARAAPPARFEQGKPALLYWPGLVAFTCVSLGLALLIVRALQAGAKGGALIIGVFLVLFIWQGGSFFRRNRPGQYRPEAPPPELLP
jgi:hypothetical protein